jgi:Zn-dependent protease with chaperone function
MVFSGANNAVTALRCIVRLLAISALFTACSPIPVTAPANKTPPTEPESKARLPEKHSTLSLLLARQERVYRVAAPLMVKNAPLCRAQARPLLGFTAKNRYSYPAELAPAVESVLGLDERLRVMQVLEGSGAMRSGIRPGDILLSIQEQPLPLGAQAESEAARLVAPLLKNAADVTVSVSREDRPLKLIIPLTTACAFSMEIGNTTQVNAYADGRRIMVTRGMLDFFSHDEELAVILAREIAHNVLQHSGSLQMAATTASVIDALLPLQPDPAALSGRGGLRPLPAKLDQDADRLAMYLLARAGYDPGASERTMEKLAQAHPASQVNTYLALHPWTTERRQLIRNTLTEIRQKQAAKKPLVP